MANNTKFQLKDTSQRDEFIAWLTRLANSQGNSKLDGKLLRKLEIELANDLLANEITLGEAEETYLRSAGLAKFNIDQITL